MMNALPHPGPPRVRRVAVVDATAEGVAGYGLFLGRDVAEPGLPIPYYAGSVVEGHNLPFVCNGRTVVRMARVDRRPGRIAWLERHLLTTQLFVVLGAAPVVLVLGKPTGRGSMDVPDVDDVIAFKIAPGHGVIIRQGTWHDFPMACGEAATVLTANSEEVVDALATASSAEELDAGDVLKIDVAKRLGVELVVELP